MIEGTRSDGEEDGGDEEEDEDDDEAMRTKVRGSA